jgi:hypothetical protein
MVEESQQSAIWDELMKSKFMVGPDGTNVCAADTRYGTLMFFFRPERMEEIFGGFIADFLWQVHHGRPLDLDAIKTACGVSPDLKIEATVDVDQDFGRECERWVGRAMEFFRKHLRGMLTEVVEQHIDETIFRSLREQSGKGLYEFKARESKLIDALVKNHRESLRQRMAARGRGGSTPWKWTDGRKAELLELYESSLKMMREAKRIYKQNRHNAKWPRMVQAAYPEFPEDLITRLSGTGKDAEPNALALEHAASVLGVEINDNLEKVLIDARHDRRQQELAGSQSRS